MTVLRGDCVGVMAGMAPDSIDTIVCDPPYDLTNRVVDVNRCGVCLRVLGGSDGNPKRCPRCGNRLERQRKARGGFMDKAWDGTGVAFRPETWYAALRVAKPGAYLLAFGGTRTVHRMTCALEDAGWAVRDMLVWAYAQGFPKSKASLKPAWEPIVLCRKPGASRDLNIDAARLPLASDELPDDRAGEATAQTRYAGEGGTDMAALPGRRIRVGGGARGSSGFAEGYQAGDGFAENTAGRWPANVVLTDPIFDGGWEGVIGGGWQSGGGNPRFRGHDAAAASYGGFGGGETGKQPVDTAGSYSRFFLIPKAPTRERVLSDGRRSPHPTQKPEALIRHLVTLVTPEGGTVLDPFLGSGTLGVVCDGLGMDWIGIEREAEYADWAEDRIADRRPAWAPA